MARRMLGRAGALGVAVVLGVATTGCEPAPTEAWRSELVSPGVDGTTPALFGSTLVDVSPDGTRILLLAMDTTALGFPDQNPQTFPDLLLRDLATGELTRITSTPDGSDGGNGGTSEAAFSADGETVVFTTLASNLGIPDANNLTDVYTYDIASGALRMVSISATGATSGNGQSSTPSFSPDGSKVVFSSQASDLGPTDTNALVDVYVRDLAADTTDLVSTNASGTAAGDGQSTVATTSSASPFSADGRLVVFGSLSRNLTSDATNGSNNVFVRDLAARTTALVSATEDGAPVPGGAASLAPAISRDGTLVAFSTLTPDSSASPPFRKELYLRNLATGTLTQLVATGAGDPRLSPDGRSIAFLGSVDVGVPDTNGVPDVYVYDVDEDELSLASLDATGTRAAAGRASAPSFSPDGKLSFVSNASDMLPGTSMASTDLYMRDLDRGATTLVSLDRAGSARAGSVTSAPAQFSADGSAIGYMSSSQTLAGRPVPAGVALVYLARVTPFARVDLAITSAVPSRYVSPGGLWSIGATATNNGPDAVDGVAVTQIVPLGVDGVTATVSGLPGACSVAAAPSGLQQVARCTVGSLAPGESVDVLVSGTATAVEVGSSLTAVTHVSAGRLADPELSNNSVVSSTGVVDPGTPPSTDAP